MTPVTPAALTSTPASRISRMRVEVVAVGGGGQRRILKRVLRADVGALGNQQPDDRRGSFAHRGDEQRRAPLLARERRLRAAVEQQPDLRDVGRRHHQRRRPERVLRVDVGALVEQDGHRLDRTGDGGVHQRRLAERHRARWPRRARRPASSAAPGRCCGWPDRDRRPDRPAAVTPSRPRRPSPRTRPHTPRAYLFIRFS